MKWLLSEHYKTTSKLFLNCFRSEKDDAVYHHLRDHPGMRFFPFGFENFVLISRTEIWDVESTAPSVRLQTEVKIFFFKIWLKMIFPKIFGMHFLKNSRYTKLKKKIVNVLIIFLFISFFLLRFAKIFPVKCQSQKLYVHQKFPWP